MLSVWTHSPVTRVLTVSRYFHNLRDFVDKTIYIFSYKLFYIIFFEIHVMDAFKRILNQSIFVFIYDAINFSVKFKVT